MGGTGNGQTSGHEDQPEPETRIVEVRRDDSRQEDTDEFGDSKSE